MNKQYFYIKINQPGKGSTGVPVLIEATGQLIKLDARKDYLSVQVSEGYSAKQYPNYFRLVATERELEDLQVRFADFYMSKIKSDVRQAPNIIDLETAHTLAVNGFYKDCLTSEDQKLIDSLIAENEAKDLRNE